MDEFFDKVGKLHLERENLSRTFRVCLDLLKGIRKDTPRKESTDFNILSLLWIQRIVAWKEQIVCGAHTKAFPSLMDRK
ncbi:hypothetical protein MTR_4g082490 [Medicago truncatula]|uniref:Uncharacterized protein n=1 Tax=Medicago truncatula TaxID=3880 RepID=G7JGB3_MEDTR|nr:hypothetical protein MTR_4g082490 [Medicago truncatula]